MGQAVKLSFGTVAAVFVERLAGEHSAGMCPGSIPPSRACPPPDPFLPRFMKLSYCETHLFSRYHRPITAASIELFMGGPEQGCITPKIEVPSRASLHA